MFRQIYNQQPIVQALQGAQGQLTAMEPIYQDIGEYMVPATKDRFRSGIGPDGIAWAPKKPATIERYRRAGDGNLFKPLIGPSKRLGNEIHYAVSSIGLELGSNLEYSGTMQGGAAKGQFGADRAGRPIPWGPIPARVWLGISETDEREILDIVDEHIGRPFEG